MYYEVTGFRAIMCYDYDHVTMSERIVHFIRQYKEKESNFAQGCLFSSSLMSTMTFSSVISLQVSTWVEQ